MIASTLLTAGSQAVGILQQGQIARANEQTLRARAAREREIGRVNEQITAENLQREIARQRAAIAAGGASLDRGSLLDLGAEAGRQAFLQTSAVRQSSDARAAGFQDQANLTRYEASLARARGIVGIGGTFVNAGSAWNRAGGSLLPTIGGKSGSTQFKAFT